MQCNGNDGGRSSAFFIGPRAARRGRPAGAFWRSRRLLRHVLGPRGLRHASHACTLFSLLPTRQTRQSLWPQVFYDLQSKEKKLSRSTLARAEEAPASCSHRPRPLSPLQYTPAAGLRSACFGAVAGCTPEQQQQQWRRSPQSLQSWLDRSHARSRSRGALLHHAKLSRAQDGRSAHGAG